MDTVQTREFASLDVLFVATLEGVIKKLVRVPGTNETCVVEEIHISAEDQQLPVRSMKLVKNQVWSCVLMLFLSVRLTKCEQVHFRGRRWHCIVPKFERRWHCYSFNVSWCMAL